MARSATARKEAAAPRARDAEATQKRILAAAKREFSRLGLGGARVDDIAEKANANKRMEDDIGRHILRLGEFHPPLAQSIEQLAVMMSRSCPPPMR